MRDTDRDKGFLTRWSDRKQAVRRSETLPDEPMAADAPGEASGRPAREAGPIADPVSDSPPEPVLTDADMPPLESLGASSDYSGFLSRGVSAALRRQALARLFHSPHLNVTDGLDDFDEDFTRFEALGDLITSDMRHQLEVAARRLAERANKEQEAIPEAVATADFPEPDALTDETAPAVAVLPDPDADSGPGVQAAPATRREPA